MPRQLSRRGRPDPEAVAELDLRDHRDPDERRDGRVRAGVAEERALELGVRALEGDVVPVEPTARLRRGDQQRDEHRAVQGLLLRRSRAGVRARVDRRRRLAQELLERDPRVLALGQRARPRLDEGAHERSVLVERRAATLHVLLERERQFVALLERPAEEDEGAETERAQGQMELR